MTTDGTTDKSPKRQAEDCAWYLLATLYGIPDSRDKDLKTKNRTAWNRFMATQLNIEARDALELKGFPADELNPLSPQELTAIEEAFRRRQTQGSDIQFPQTEKVIDFSNVHFDRFEADDFLFAIDVTFSGATFNRLWALFYRVTFNGTASFEHATFDCSAYFGGAIFNGKASFDQATFHSTNFEGTIFNDQASFDGATINTIHFNGAIFGYRGYGRAVSFCGATFIHAAHFSPATFSGEAAFDRATFGEVHFYRLTFDRVSFDHAIFQQNTHFNDTTFKNANFNHASFHGDIYFNSAIFDAAEFNEAAFAGETFFGDAVFKGTASFNDATFGGRIFFNKTSFGSVSFDNTKFKNVANFFMAQFDGESRFINSTLENETSFRLAKFVNQPPLFFGATMHGGTTWDRVEWPMPPDSADLARHYIYGPDKFVHAYARLKFEMERLKKHEDELNFFALEMQARRMRDGFWEGLPIDLYGWLCDYGRSYLIPLCWLFALTVIGALALWLHFGLACYVKAFGLSIANTLAVFGFQKYFVSGLDVYPNWVIVVSGFQTVFGSILLFLLGLGIRNRFRMK